MSEWLSRKSLYDLVWSEPLSTLSERFGISDVALRKTCQRAKVPTPERGYWAKKASGKKIWAVPLPERPPAMDDELQVGGRHEYWHRSWTDEEILRPLPPPPEFDIPLDSVRERITKEIEKVTVAHKVTWWHPVISRLLNRDKERREKEKTSSYVFSWEKPKFESPNDQRRLRIFNALFTAVGRFQARPYLDVDAVSGSISFYSEHIPFRLEPSKVRAKGKSSNESTESEGNLTLSILEGYNSEHIIQSWSDDESGRIEKRLAEIAIEIVFMAEFRYRKGVERRHEFRKESRANLIEEMQLKKLAAERAELERIQTLEKARIDRLLGQATAFEQATVIRKYVEAVENAVSHLSDPPIEKLNTWSRWAMAEADRIDPTIGERFFESMIETS